MSEWWTATARTQAQGTTRTRTRLVLVALFAIVLLRLIGGGPEHASRAAGTVSGGGGAAQRGGTAVLGLTIEPSTLNQYLVNGGWPTFVVMKPVMDQWIDVDPKNRLVPQLAAAVPTPGNGGVSFPGTKMLITFDIDERAHWSDRRRVTCSDMAFTWRTVLDDRWLILARNGWEKIESVSCPSPRRVVLTFREPYAPWPQILRQPPLPAHALKARNFNRVWNAHIPVSSGPFVVDRWRPGVHLRLKRNPNFWRAGKEQLPHLDGIEFRFFKTENAINLQLSSGELHMLNRGLENLLKDERRLFPNHKVLVTRGTGARMLGFQTRRKAVRDPRVRRAIAHAIDREQIADRLMRRPFTVMQSTLGVQQEPYHIDAWKQYRYDRAKVRKLLTAAGYRREGKYWEKDGKALELSFKSYADKTYIRRLTQLLQQQLEREGIKMTIALEPISVLYGQSMPQGTLDIGVWGIGLGYDPEQRGYFACPQGLKKALANNPYRYCDKKATALFEASNRARTIPQRVAIVHEIQRKMAKDMPILPLFQDFDEVVYTPKLHNISPNSQGNIGWNSAEWWLER